jgi:putative transposase
MVLAIDVNRQPARKLRPNRRSVTGFYITRDGRKLQFESQLERDALLLLDFEPGISIIGVQVRTAGRHVTDCEFACHSSRYLVEVKPEQDLVQNWKELFRELSAINSYCLDNGFAYTFITDVSISAFQNRLAVLKQMRYLGNGDPELETKREIVAILEGGGAPLTIRSLADKTETLRDHASKVREVCKLLVRGSLVILSTPSEQLDECSVSLGMDPEKMPELGYVLPYARLVRRIEFHPYSCLGAGKPQLDGNLLTIQGKAYELVQKKCREDAVVKNLETGEVYPHIDTSAILNPSDLDLPNSEEASDIAYLHWLKEEHLDLFEQFLQRKNAVFPLLRMRERSSKDVEDAAAVLGESPRQVWRLINAYEKEGPRGLVSKQYLRGGKGPPHLQIDRRIEAIVDQYIHEEYLTKQRRRKIEIYDFIVEHIDRDPELRGVRPPSKSYVYRKIAGLDPKIVLARRYGAKAYDETYGGRGGEFRDKLFPLHTVEIDTTKLDVILRDSLGAVGRPYLTVALDVYSRCVWGYHLSLLEPNAADAVGLTIIMGVFKKDQYVRQFGLAKDWPTHGVPAQIQSDNGKDFRATMVELGCCSHNIGLLRRPVKKPRYGAYIERFFGTLNTKFIQRLPGNTFSNTLERKKGEYNPEKDPNLLTIDALERLLVKFIVLEYHETYHSELRMTPNEKWRTGIEGTPFQPQEPPDPEIFRLDFLPCAPDQEGRRTIQNGGVHFQGFAYYSPKLEYLPRFENDNKTPRRYVVRYDPMDLRYLYLLDDREGKWSYHTLLLRNMPPQPLLMKQWRSALTQLRERGNRKPTFSVALDYVREITDNEKTSTNKKTRRTRIGTIERRKARERLSKAPNRDYGDGATERKAPEEYEPHTRPPLRQGIRLSFAKEGETR